MHFTDKYFILFQIEIAERISIKNDQTQSDGTEEAFIRKIFQLWIRHNLTLVCLEDLMKLMNEKPYYCTQFPTKKKQILRLMKNEDGVDPVYYTYCPQCKTYSKCSSVRNDQTACSHCETELRANETNYFVYLPIAKQITKTVKDHWSSIHAQSASTDDGIIRDVHDGQILKNIEKVYEKTDSTIYSLTLFLDGANRYKSTTRSIWPIQLVQNLLPPSERYNLDNILIAGLYYSDKKPDCMEYFLPLVQELKKLLITNIEISVQGKHLKILPIITNCVVDLPAKSHLQQITQYNGKNACTYCLHPGYQVQMNKKKVTRYTCGDRKYDLRTHEQTVNEMLRADRSGERINGVKGDYYCFSKKIKESN